EQPVIGVLMPSIDRVGRYFPLTIAQPLPRDSDLASLIAGDDAWFEEVEALLLSTLEPDAEVEQFEQAVLELDCLQGRPRTALNPLGAGWQGCAAATGAERGAVLAQLASENASCWWGKGSAAIGAGLLRCQGLPPSHAFGRLLVGAGAAYSDGQG
ncbi:MAG TPA: type VI secretion system-associated protein TagF, partial [Pseudomonas sp.]|nr:type VI secretion system-associated protein TagF [Pseudomonas sp.]